MISKQLYNGVYLLKLFMIAIGIYCVYYAAIYHSTNTADLQSLSTVVSNLTFVEPMKRRTSIERIQLHEPKTAELQPKIINQQTEIAEQQTKTRKHHKSIKVEHQPKPETLQTESKERPPAIHLEPAITLPQNTSVSLLQSKNRTVLLGVFSHACELEARRRTRIRNTWAAKLPDQVRMIFVLCENHGDIDNSTTTNLANEKNIFNDILLMPCTENMDHGKTFTFMSTAHIMLSREAENSNSFVEYIMKIDGDSVLGVNALLKFLRLDKVPSDKPAIFGCQYLWSLDDWRKFKAPANMDYGHYMNGGGYGFSRVALDFIASSSYVRNHTIGYEDKMSGLWMMKLGSKAKWYNMCAHPTAFIDSTWIKNSGRFGEPLTTEVAIIHHVKEELIWNSVHKGVEKFEALNKGGDYTGEIQYDCSYLSGAIDLKFNSKRRWCERPLKI